jgi:N utilization substance protein B
MSLHRQPRSVARELALLSLSQFSNSSEKLSDQDLNKLILAAVRTLVSEVQENLEKAAEEANRSHQRLLSSEIRASNLTSAKAMVQEAIGHTESAINRLSTILELPETIQLANHHEVRSYALEIIGTVNRYEREIKETIEKALVDWKYSRLPRVDRDIIRIAVAEILYIPQTPQKTAIDESVKLAKRYSDEEGYRFINGVLRRVVDKLTDKVDKQAAKINQ